MPSASVPDRRGLGVAVVLAIGFGAAALSQAKLQTIEREKTLRLAREAHRYVQTIQERARRGSILAADGLDDTGVREILAASRADDGPLMPSVETFMHAWLLTLPGVNVVGHCHLHQMTG
ncbi:MAG: hypothetical protein EON94_12660 [Caulobacteraceae bacterium]|nr:MAG: hypothetical protein EON94_12660 [Caulobacteraceae bacterium]